ncbi:SAM-dependent methyltransferase [Streptomyces sp. NPDC002812]|uniref:SAM-dependent methyltransferase n=1 Tax=Streptomyces sp. NPDC002812 TaxID=3154434 RepID=UPI0033191C5A
MSSVQLLSEPSGLDDSHFTRANSARISDLLCGGTDNYAADRAAVYAVQEHAGWLKDAALIDRDYGLRTVQVALDLGARQFLDLGCGYRDNLRAITARTLPGVPIVYVDRDPGVYHYGRCVLDESAQTTVIHADLLAMEQLLTCDAVHAAFDLTRPIAVLLHDVLPWCPDDLAVRQAMAILREWLPVGSLLSLTHLTDHWHRATMPDVAIAYARHGLTVRPRCRAEIADLFGDFIQQGLGLTATGRWHPWGRYRRYPDEHSAAFAGIGVKTTDPRPRPHQRNRPH